MGISFKSVIKNMNLQFLTVLVLANIMLWPEAEVFAAPASKLDASCSIANDIYENPIRISSDSKMYADQCVDSKRFRYVQIISETATDIEFANYNHNNSYWSAKISKDAVIEKVYFQIAKFEAVSGVTAAHTQLRFKFANKAIKLTGQEFAQTTEVDDMILSFEAARPENVSYNFALGAIDNYVAVGRVVSSKQRLFEYANGVTIEQYEIDIPQAERMLLVILGLQKSAKDKADRFYNTISENCTTDIFYVIDELPSEKGLNEPFYTVISNDPIATPSLEALNDRGILLNRYADLKDEIEFGATKPPTVLTSPPSPGILPTVKDSQYSIVFSSPAKGSLSPRQVQAIESVKELTYRLLPKAFHLLGSSLMLGEGDSKEFLLNFLKSAAQGLKTELNTLNQDLPEEAVNITVYFAPWNKAAKVGQKLNMQKAFNVKARLPFEFYSIDDKDNGYISTAINMAAQTPEISDLGFQVYALALQFNLLKNNWSVALQTLGGLKDRKQAMNSANTQVKIYELEIPNVKKLSERPVALMTLTQKYNQNTPEFEVEFGAYGGIKPKSNMNTYGQLNIFKSEYNCMLQAQSSPVLHGHFAESATGYSVIDYLFEGKDVRFNIFKVNFDLQTQKVSSMDVRFFFRVLGFPIQCLSQDKVNQSFKQNVNSELEKLTNSLQDADHTKLIEPVINKVFSNNPNNQVPGLN